MSHAVSTRKPNIDWVTVIAIASIAISLNVALHEGMHALACFAVGSQLQEYSALYVSCESPTTSQGKIVAGSAPIYNLIAGVFLWIILRNSRKQAPEVRFFLWLFMLMNWFYGAGYLIFSGIANIGDWAVVIDGWEPSWLLRGFIVVVGLALFVIFVRLGLKEFGKVIGDYSGEQIRSANKLCIVSYFTSLGVVLIAGLFCPFGFLSLPVTAGAFAVIGALSPFLGMTRWMRTNSFEIDIKEPLEIHRKWGWLVAAVIVLFAYVFILGPTLYF